tara:strand:+ start:58 stop:1560 length:1503 start_codon:yes stop_codon:yes gene_type:complete
MAGLGDRATGLMSMLFGGDEETTPEGGGGNGAGNIMTNVSNQMFNGMSQEQVYRMGQSFNTLRFEPDDRMAANFESRIAQIQSDKKTTATTNATIDFLKKNKRDDLAEMVSSGIYSAAKAVDLAMTVTKDPDWLAKLKYVQQMMIDGKNNGGTGTVEDIPQYLHGILDIETEKTPEFMQRMQAIANPPTDPRTGAVIPWTDQQLEVGFGIKKDDVPVFRAALDEIDSLAKLDPETYTKELVLQMKLKKLGALVEEPADANTIELYKYYKENLPKGEKPLGFLEYQTATKGGNTSVDITMPSLDANTYGDLQTSNLVKNHNTQVDGIDGLLSDVKELHKIQAILDEAVDGQIKFGMLEPLYTKASQFAKSIGLSDGNQATKVQLMQSAFGGETFKMLKILGLGTKGIDTVPERIFLQESFVGTPGMTVEQLQIMTQQRLDILTQGIEEYNKRINGRTVDGQNSAYFKLYEETFSVQLKPVEVPIRAGAKKIQTNATVSKYF